MKVFVVGGGAAGMMAAIHSADSGADVTLFEKNEKLGKKVYITGKGRCNVTNSSDAEVFFKNVNRNPKFLYSAFYGFDNNMVYSFIEEQGCPLKIERGNRVFPVSDKSSDIIRAFSKALSNRGVNVKLNTEVKELLVSEGICEGLKLKDGKSLYADRIILATGGLSYPSTGSTGDGYRFAEALGHSIVKPLPSLVPIEIEEDFYLNLQGLSLKNVSLKVYVNGKVKYSDMGEMLFTHFGISGPLILSASSVYTECKERGDEVSLSLDLKPALTYEELDKRVLKDFDENKNRKFKNALDKLLPQTLIPVIVKLSEINEYKNVNEISREERLRLVSLLKDFKMTPVGTRSFNEAIITKGGINVKEVNASTMESKLVKNLFFAGEILDVDAMTGGYNLQIAFSTGYLAGDCE